MKKHKTASINVNLLPQDPFFLSPVGKTLRWALSAGRYIVIFTELVVIVSFGSRFVLDRQVTDLNDEIFQKETIIRSYGDLEATVRATQFKVEQYQQVQQQENIVDIFPELSAITPRDVTLDSLTIKPAQISLEGSTASQNSFNIFINNIQLSQKFFNVTVDRIEANKGRQAGLYFQLRADTKPAQANTSAGAGARTPAAQGVTN